MKVLYSRSSSYRRQRCHPSVRCGRSFPSPFSRRSCSRRCPAVPAPGTVPSRCSWSTRRRRPRRARVGPRAVVRHGPGRPDPDPRPRPALRAGREVVPPLRRSRGDRRDPPRRAHHRRGRRVRQYGDPLRQRRHRRPAAGPRVVQRHHPLPGRGEDGPGRDVREGDDRHDLRRPGVGRVGHPGRHRGRRARQRGAARQPDRGQGRSGRRDLRLLVRVTEGEADRPVRLPIRFRGERDPRDHHARRARRFLPDRGRLGHRHRPGREPLPLQRLEPDRPGRQRRGEQACVRQWSRTTRWPGSTSPP